MAATDFPAMSLLRTFSILLSLALAATPALSNTITATEFFEQLYDSADKAIFPVAGRTLDDIESAFGPRQQQSTDLYDWHRGFDVDGTDQVDSIVAALDGYFYDYRYSSRGGYTVILEHHFADFTNDTVTFHGQTVTKFYTWSLHVWDDGNEGNGTSTDDIVSGWARDDPISQGTQIAILSNSGSSGGDPYAPHLHYDLRIGTNSSLEYQLDNVGSTTQWGFDPHVNPMLLFDPGYPAPEQTLEHASGTLGADDLVFDYSVPDEYTVFNNLSVLIRDGSDLSEIASHELDLNLRTGFDASDVDLLDTQVTSVPYIDPLDSPFDTDSWSTQFVVPDAFLDEHYNQGYELVLTATDIWGNSVSTSLSLSAVPEPAQFSLVLSGFALVMSGLRRRGRRINPTQY